jgi:hypothetical protein
MSAYDINRYSHIPGRYVPYVGRNVHNIPFIPSGSAIPGFGTLDLGTRTKLENAVFKKEYEEAHPFKTAYSKATGSKSGYTPLGDVSGIAADIGIDAAASKHFTGTPTPSAGGGGGLKGFYGSKIAPNFGWSKGSGIKAFGKNVGKWGNIAGGAIQGIEALGNLQDLNESQSTTDDLIGDILTSANANPLVSSYLTPDQLSLLRQVKRGDLEPETEFEDFLPNDISDFGDIIKDAGLGLLIGGIPGALIGGVGGAVNSGLSGATEDQAQQNAELEMLLQALEDANVQYQSMKRPNLPALGIQSRYQNMYY